MRARIWLGLTQLGAGEARHAQASFAAARDGWRERRGQDGPPPHDRLDALISEWILRAKSSEN